MKNQCFGDGNDYRKYGLLRDLTSDEIRAAVCWMLTPDGGYGDGRVMGYLEQRDKWHHFDPPLLHSLRQLVQRQNLRDLRGAT
jgi:hypothetical protein